MGLLSSLFKKAFKEEAGAIGEREMEFIVKAADNIFVGEEEEKNLFSKEADKTQKLINLTRKLVKTIARDIGRSQTVRLDAEIKLLYNIFIYLRSHTIDKFNSLKKIHKNAVVIAAEAQQCEKYDQIFGLIMRNRNVKFRRKMLKEKLADLNTLSLAMRDINKKSKDIDETIKILEDNTENMLNILSGQSTGEVGIGKINLPQFLKSIKALHPLSSVGLVVSEIVNTMQDLRILLEKESDAIPLLYDNIHSIEIRERKLLRLMKQTGLRAA